MSQLQQDFKPFLWFHPLSSLCWTASQMNELAVWIQGRNVGSYDTFSIYFSSASNIMCVCVCTSIWACLSLCLSVLLPPEWLPVWFTSLVIRSLEGRWSVICFCFTVLLQRLEFVSAEAQHVCIEHVTSQQPSVLACLLFAANPSCLVLNQLYQTIAHYNRIMMMLQSDSQNINWLELCWKVVPSIRES